MSWFCRNAVTSVATIIHFWTCQVTIQWDGQGANLLPCGGRVSFLEHQSGVFDVFVERPSSLGSLGGLFPCFVHLPHQVKKLQQAQLLFLELTLFAPRMWSSSQPCPFGRYFASRPRDGLAKARNGLDPPDFSLWVLQDGLVFSEHLHKTMVFTQNYQGPLFGVSTNGPEKR